MVGLAQQADAPVLAGSAGGFIAAWVGGDDRGIHQDARRVENGVLGEVVTLPLPPTRPYAQALVAGTQGQTHLLWLDADTNGQNTLYAALLAADLTVERGPVRVSEGLALEFSSVSDGTGGLWTAWSGGMIAEPIIYVRRSDDEGRPLLQTTTIGNGEHPALVRTASGEIWLFWLANGELKRQRLDSAERGETDAVTGTISLAPGDQIVNVQAAVDATSAYFFWNVTRANGVSETWWTAGTLNVDAWRQPARLTHEAGGALRWTAPVDAPLDFAAAAVASDAGLGIVRFSEGKVAGYKMIVAGVGLIGMPTLITDAEGDFTLAWSVPGETSAELRLMMVGR